MTIYDVFQAIGSLPLINRCQGEDYQCENFPKGGCSLYREFSLIQSAPDQELRRTPLSAVFS